MKVVLNNNKISLINATKHEDQEVSNLWKRVREDYIDWLENFRLIKVDNDKTIADRLWNSLITKKDLLHKNAEYV